MKAGFASSDITPRVGVQLCGYGPYRNRASNKITAPLLARAIVLSEGKRRQILLNLELCGLPRDYAWTLREAVVARVGGKVEDVFLTVTHTHSGPSVGGMIGWGEPDAMYVATLPARVADAAERAVAAQQAVEWRYAEVPCEGIAINRETDEGGWKPVADPLDVRLSSSWRPKRPEDTDPTLRLLAAYAGDKLVGVLHHFGCHAVVGSEQTFDVHGDFVGVASQLIERSYPGATALFLPGAIGDINPPVCHRGPKETSRALTVLAKKYAGVIQRGLKVAQPLAVDGVAGVQREVLFSRKPWPRAWVTKRIAELEAIFAKPGMTDDTRAGKLPLNTSGLDMVRLHGLRTVLAQFDGAKGPNRPVMISGLKIGPVLLLGVGLEVFHSLQAPILAGSPHPHTWLVSLAGGIGYAPDARACAKQGYTDDLVPSIAGERPYAKIFDEVPRELVKLAREMA